MFESKTKTTSLLGAMVVVLMLFSVQDVYAAAKDSKCVSISAPASVSGGSTFPASIVMQNTGTDGWIAPDMELGSQNPQDNTRWGLNRVPVPAYTDGATTQMFVAKAGDGNVTYSGSSVWTTARNAANGTALNYTGPVVDFRLANSASSPFFTIKRLFFPFDTSLIPANSIIVSATLGVYLSGTLFDQLTDNSKDYTVVVQTSQASTASLSTSDFSKVDFVAGSQTHPFSSLVPGAYHTWDLNTANLNWIAKSGEISNCGLETGTTCLGILEGHDFSNSAPTGTGANSINTSLLEVVGTNMDPYLTVTFAPPSSLATFNFNATAPAAGGTYNFDWKMVEQGVVWFGETCTKTIDVISMPDLTAGDVSFSPATILIATPIDFYSTISNIGDASTGSDFLYFFQVAYAADGGGLIIDKPPSLMSAKNAGETGLATLSQMFASPGIYSVRVCADKERRDDLGEITESNEDNNCSNWENIVVKAPAQTVIMANDTTEYVSINYNDEVDITWKSINAESCTVTPPNWTELNAPSGTHVLNLVTPTTYMISCLPAGPLSVDTVLVDVPDALKNLNVIKSGQGTITSTPVGVSCGSGCQTQTYSFPPDTDVTLEVTVAPGRIFTGWSGDCSGRATTCVVKMDSDKSIIANFAIKPNSMEF